MDPQILEFLKSNNLLSAQQYFEGYDFDAFKKLEPHHLRELIESPRERILFEIKHRELKQLSDVLNLPDQAAPPDQSAKNVSQSVQEDSVVPVDAYVVNPEMTLDMVLECDEFELVNETFVINESQTFDGDKDDELQKKKLSVAADIQSIEGSSSSNVNDLPTTYTKISESQVFKEMNDFDMDIVYGRYAKNGSLEPSDRGKISR